MDELAPPDSALLQAAFHRAGFVETERPVIPGPTPQSVRTEPPPPTMRSVLRVVRPDGGTTFHLPRRAAPPAEAAEAAETAERIETAGPDLLEFDLPPDVTAPLPVGGAGSDAVPDVAAGITVLDVGLGELAEGSFAAAYAAAERRLHPYVLRRVDAGADRPFAGPDAGDAAAFAGQRVLLFVHGIFGTCNSAFGALPAACVAQLTTAYDAVLAFDHPSASADPAENVAWLQDRLRAADGVTLDVITHSRGGLVARALAAAYGTAAAPSATAASEAPAATVRRIAFVGTPNAGTEIVDPRRWGALLDRFANLTGAIPGGAAPLGDFLAELFELLKAAAFGIADGFPGLECMLPGSPFLEQLAAVPPPAPELYAIDTDFRPWGFLRSVFDLRREFVDGAEVLVDRPVFDGRRNDVAVPTDSVGLGHSGAGFPVPAASSHLFGPDEHVWHLTYFDQPATVDLLTAWFAGQADTH